MKKTFLLTADYITLGQLLKEVDVISSGGMAKWYLQEHAVYVDGELENRRGRKLYAEMMIDIPGVGTFFMAKNPEETD
ncbi:RNA-binding protein [Vagococcus penaei]|uniref:RNA-binding protein n=1 Tax=Vagococcus penaei TaxID=633807 RepID=A0A1Q2D641_9ENTE|nr:S4 domain-containing protein YaaA [Vagococcus penaei]AQP53889.1 RNA-binding protein [Vagococcus penaei]RSU02947.1 RNA-binding protein [Vagococcus penaei]